MSTVVHQHFHYWNESLLEGQLPNSKAHRYIVFDADLGGLNNIRIVFEYLVVMAAVTGRTLVLPPASSWYLINHGPMPTELQGGVTQLSDLYDVRALTRAIPVMTTDEFIQEAKDHLLIPAKLQNFAAKKEPERELFDQWSAWLLENAEVPPWIPYNTVLAFPTIEQASSGPHFNEQYIDNREPVEFTPRMNAAPVLYFPSNDVYRSLGPVATMLACPDNTLPVLSRRLLKNHVRFRAELFELANTIIDRLGLNENATVDAEGRHLTSYDAMQIRRNDFQYEGTQIGVQSIAENVAALFDKGFPIYVATDENREEIFTELGQLLNAPKVFSWRDVATLLDEPIPYAWIGPLEQLICTPARRFVGTDLSTFTGYIHRMRGYLPAQDDNLYYHSESYSKTLPTTGTPSHRGRDYLRENPSFWQSC